MEHLLVNENYPGLIKTGQHYRFNGDLISTGVLIIIVPLQVTGKIEASKWIEAGEGIEAGWGIEAEVKKVFGKNTDFYVPMQIHWPTYILTDWMKIGCEFHTIDEWKSFTDEEICAMDSCALEFWRSNKDMLIGVHDTMKQRTQDSEK